MRVIGSAELEEMNHRLENGILNSKRIGCNFNAECASTTKKSNNQMNAWLTRRAVKSSMRGVVLHLTLLLSGDQAPELVDVDGRAVKLVQGLVEVTHTNFAEITRMAGMQGYVTLGKQIFARAHRKKEAFYLKQTNTR